MEWRIRHFERDITRSGSARKRVSTNSGLGVLDPIFSKLVRLVNEYICDLFFPEKSVANSPRHRRRD